MQKMRFLSANDAEAARQVIRQVKDGSPKHINLVNAYSLSTAERDSNYEPYSASTSLNLFDGFLLAFIYRKFLCDMPVKSTRGVDLLRSVLSSDQDHEIRHYFICGSSEIESVLLSTIFKLDSSIKIVGSWVPSKEFSNKEYTEEIRKQIIASGCNLIWIGLGTPKQDRLSMLVTNTAEISSIGVGAAFEIFTELKLECPSYLRRLGLEWLYRLVQEPTRLWRRYSLDMYYFSKSLKRISCKQL